MSTRDTLDFLLYDWLAADRLCERARFAELLRPTEALVLSDEVYEHMVYDDLAHASMSGLPELAARVYSVIRRRQFGNANTVRHNELTIDLLSKAVSVDGREVPLTKKELGLLLFFVGNKNRVVSKSALAEHLSGDFADMLDSHDFVYAHIKNLKRKLAEAGCGNYLKTIYGTGYRWEA